MTIYEQRVKRLRDHVLANQAKKEEETVHDDFVNDVENAIEKYGEEVVFEQKEVINFEKITVTELKELLDEKGIKYNAKAKKGELFKLLEGAE